MDKISYEYLLTNSHLAQAQFSSHVTQVHFFHSYTIVSLSAVFTLYHLLVRSEEYFLLQEIDMVEKSYVEEDLNNSNDAQDDVEVVEDNNEGNPDLRKYLIYDLFMH